MDTPFGMAAMSAFTFPGPKLPRPAEGAPVALGRATLAGMDVLLDPTGALYWPAEDLLVVSDLHLETGSSYARTGQMLPPYDTAITLAALAEAVRRHRPSRVLSLGDTFHDPFGAERLAGPARDMLASLMDIAEFIWITGNHEKDGAAALGGSVHEAITIAGTTFRHIPSAEPAEEREVAGHLHPAARISLKGRTLKRRCFVGCARRLVMPAMGCLTGGLPVSDPVFASLWPTTRPELHLMGRNRVYALGNS
ncbi:ligase-associated DNA damage response endonuclease PdeM [Acuticoccus sediminis]|nr:ligase-associated DNA damage response endonuclease PdeM [Acuticoccus sediminis]